jgi:hypothetical protein
VDAPKKKGTLILSNKNESSDDEDENDPFPANQVLMDRSALMDNILFPENSEDLVIIPSNKEGTGFLNHCYSKKYLHCFLHEEEFNHIVLSSSKLAANAYSRKRILDKMGIPQKVKVQMNIAVFLAACSLVTILISNQTVKNMRDNALALSQVFLAPTMLIMMLITARNWKEQNTQLLSFDEMVKIDMDNFYKRINIVLAERGV